MTEELPKLPIQQILDTSRDCKVLLIRTLQQLCAENIPVPRARGIFHGVQVLSNVLQMEQRFARTGLTSAPEVKLLQAPKSEI